MKPHETGISGLILTALIVVVIIVVFVIIRNRLK